MNKISSRIFSLLGSHRCSRTERLFCTALPSTEMSPLSYCIEKVQQNDHENYLCTIVLPTNLKIAAITLRAFNVEVASVADQVSEKIIGDMRFQFWEDAVDKIYAKDVPNHPVCVQLAKAVHQHKLSKIHLKRLISARRKNVVSPGFGTFKDAEEYCDSSNTPIYLLILEAAGVKNMDSDHAASHLGKAQGLTNMLRSTIYHSKRRKVILPQELLIKHKVSQEEILRHTASTNVKDMAFDLATRIHHHLEHVKKLQKKLDRVSKHILLPRICAENYLKNLRRTDFDIFHPTLGEKFHNLAFKLLLKKIFS